MSFTESMGDPMDLDDDDDEETLQLKLQEIQAQLRLKKLRKDKARAVQDPHTSSGQTSDADNGRTSRPDSASMGRPAQRIKEIRRTDMATRPKSQPPPVEVPASPVRKAEPPPAQTSPSRVLLGIDKGLRGKDISLKRAPSFRRSSDDPGGSPGGGYLRSTRVSASFDDKSRPPLSFSERLKNARDEENVRQEQRQKSARARSTAFNVGREEMEGYKSNATDIVDDVSPKDRNFTREEILGTAATSKSRTGYLKRSNTTSSLRPSSSFTGTDRASQGSPEACNPQTSFSSMTSEPAQATSNASFEPYSCFHLNKRILPHQIVARAITGKTTYSLKDLLRHVKSPDWSLPDDVVDCVVFAVVASKSDPRNHKPQYDAATGKMKPSDRGKYMVITLVDLEYEVDLFLFNSGFERFWKLSTGTVVAILNPDIMPPPPGKQDTGRFSLTINSDADTILEIGSARDLGYCKSVKADGKLCNTWVNARRTEHCEFHTNTALSRTRSARMEINGASGLGHEKGNHREARWLGKKQSEEAVRREKVAETHGKFDRESGSRYFVGGGRGATTAALMDQEEAGNVADTRERAEGLKRRLAAQEKERDIAMKLGDLGGGGLGGQYMRLAGATTSASSARTSSRASRVGGRMAPPTASRFNPDLRPPARPLPGTKPNDDPPPRNTDAHSLGLIAPRGSEYKISLSPIKRKRQDSAQSSFDSTTNRPAVSSSSSSLFSSRPQQTTSHLARSSSNRTAAAGGGGSNGNSGGSGGFGWGTSLKDKLSRMRDGEKLANNRPGLMHVRTDSTSTITSAFRDKDRSPVRKKTRFVTDKGIREAGRESLPGSVRPGLGALRAREVVLDDDHHDDDDDDEEMDELVVVR